MVDNSVAAKWLFPEELSEDAARLLRDGNEIDAPELIIAEFANVVWKRARAGTITHWEAGELQFEFRRQPLTTHLHRDLAESAIVLALEHDHPVYDCFYLALALELGCQCVTADRRFYSVFVSAYPETMLWVEDVPEA